MLSNLRFKRKISFALVFVLIAVMSFFPGTSSAVDPNVALASAGAQASGLSDNSIYAAGKAIDDNESTYWAKTSTSQETWTVTLDGLYNINTIILKNNYVASVYHHYYIECSSDGTTWNKVVKRQGGFIDKTNDDVVTQNGDTYENLAAYGVKYLRVTFTLSSNSIKTISEFQAFGVPATDLGIGESGKGLKDYYVTVPVLDQSGQPVQGLTHTTITRSSTSNPSAGPFKINLLMVDSLYSDTPYQGKIFSKLCGDKVKGAVSLQDEASSISDIYAAINGSFFIRPSSLTYPYGISESLNDSYMGTVGASASLLAVNGEITNESIYERSAMYLFERTYSSVEINKFRSNQGIRVYKNGDLYAYKDVNGLNRKLGVKFGVKENYVSSHDTICHDSDSPAFPYPTASPAVISPLTDACDLDMKDEIVLYSDKFGQYTESTTGESSPDPNPVEVIILSNGVVDEIKTNLGNQIPTGGRVLAGIGTGADWIRANIEVGDVIYPSYEAYGMGSGMPNPIYPETSIISGGPLLIYGGVKNDNDDFRAEGFINPYMYQKHARTMVGEKGDNTLLIAVIEKTSSIKGVDFLECADMMEALGAYNAMCLDGGGSSGMYIGGNTDDVINTEDQGRRLGDILVLKP